MTSQPPKAVAAPVAHLNPPSLFDMSPLGFAQVSVAEPGRLAFLSGQVAGYPGEGPMPSDLAAQAEIVAANLKKALTELSATANDVVMVRVYVVNATPARFGEVMPTLAGAFSGGQPSITTIGVQALYAPDCQLEVEMVVRAP